MATIRPAYPFSADDDAKKLRKAMKGLGTDEAAIIEILCTRSAQQRQEIIKAYKQMHGRIRPRTKKSNVLVRNADLLAETDSVDVMFLKDLIKDLKSELRGNFEDVIIGLMTPLDEYLATIVKSAIKGMGTDEDTLIEILCTRSNAELTAIKEAFQRIYGTSLEEEVAGDLSGDLKHLMVALMNAKRPERTGIDTEKARREAKELLDAGVDKWGTDEEAFIAIFCSNSHEQLRATFHEYRALAGHDIMEAIEREMSGDLKKAMLAIVKSMFNTPLYFAELLHKSMKGMGTDDNTLIRIIIARCEIDLAHIRQEYMRIYERTLENDIKGDTSGDYKKSLLKITSGAGEQKLWG